jgi:hypothetical protein
VRHHDRLAEAQQDRAARALGVELLAQPGELSVHQHAADGGDRPGADRVADRARQGLGGCLEHLQGDVPGEAVGHDHVGARGGKVEALDVPDEVEAAARQPLVRGQHVRRALPGLLPHAQEAHPGPLDPVHGGHEACAHVGELHEVLGTHLDAGARVEQQHVTVRERQQHRERRPEDAADAPDRESSSPPLIASGESTTSACGPAPPSSARGPNSRTGMPERRTPSATAPGPWSAPFASTAIISYSSSSRSGCRTTTSRPA